MNAIAKFADILPAAMAEADRWLLWKSIPNPDSAKKPRKVPFYANGTPRNGQLDTQTDYARLTSLDTAATAFDADPGTYAGLGFALGPDGYGEHWQGVDLDDINAHSLQAVSDALPGYVERSPSGKGLHAIGLGVEFQTLGSNGSGVEAYSRARYFTVTADFVRAAELIDLAPFVTGTLAPIHSLPGAHEAAPEEPARPLTLQQTVEVRSALAAIPSDDRDLWVKFALTLKPYGTQGRALWIEWSQSSAKYDAEDARRVWETARPTGGVDTATIFYAAQRCGWANPARGGTIESDPGIDNHGRKNEWPEPQPLTSKTDPQPYPLDALPKTLMAAVREVQAFVQAPTPLVAASALSTLSLASQAHVDVKRADRLQGPASLFNLTLADSGERKTACDGFFTSAIREYQTRQEALAKPELESHEAEIDAWNAQRDGLKAAIKDATKKGADTAKLFEKLNTLQHDKPIPPRFPALLLGDETPENLAWKLAKQWPSAGVVSSEAGLIFGAHGMGRDSVLRNLALLNVLWDGGSHSVGRRTSESFVVRGARLTVGLQIQEQALRSFFESSGGLARGTGFLARFLIAWPESTQGTRFFVEAPEDWPNLSAFHRRISEILEQPAPIDEDGTLSPSVLPLHPEAKAAWIAFHDAVEAELSAGGALYDVRDVASKTADNAARLAALFHLFEHGVGPVGLDAFEGASRIAAWHLTEARRFFGELALPEELADAARLDTWLIDYCDRERTHIVGKREALRLGPLRKDDRIKHALDVLYELDRVRLAKEGRKNIVLVNPALLSHAPHLRVVG